MNKTRFAAVAGQFYPLDPTELEGAISDFIDPTGHDVISNVKYRAFIFPHSSYKQCGSVMGEGYAKLLDHEIDEVFMLTGSHFHQVEGVVLSDFTRWETPLGYVEESHRRDKIVSSDDISSHDLFQQDSEIFDGEHSIEVHLPFLQYLWGDEFRILPMVVGKSSPRLVASTLVKHLDPDDLIICSSELSHGYPADYAKEIDKKSIEAILRLDVDAVLDNTFKSFSQNSIATLLEIARLKSWKADLLLYQNSSEIAKREVKTVGYAAIGFHD